MSAPSVVGLNALFLDPGVSGGSETYLRCLVPALVAAFPGIRFEIATTRRGAAALGTADWADSVKLFRLPCDDDEPIQRTLVEQITLPRLARARGWEVLHSLGNRAPLRAGAVSVVTVHDVIFFEYRTMGAVSTHGMRWAVRVAAAGADAVISVSDASADAISRTLSFERARITPVPHGPGGTPGRAAPAAVVAGRYGLLGGRVVLCVAAKRPHKNHRLLIEALPRLPGDVRLVLVGYDEGYGSELARAAAAAGQGDRVRLLDYVGEDELEALWELATCAAFPTRAEGFGLPVLEAMRRGVPIACSDIRVLREVAGGAGRYFDPDDPAGAAAAIGAALRSDKPDARGLERAAQFTWERSAQQTVAVYERALRYRSCTSR